MALICVPKCGQFNMLSTTMLYLATHAFVYESLVWGMYEHASLFISKTYFLINSRRSLMVASGGIDLATIVITNSHSIPDARQ